MGLSEHKFAIFKLILLALVFIVLISYLILSHYRSHIIKNWTNYRNNPFIIPFAGFLRKEGEKRGFIEFTKYNFKAWHWTLSKTYFGYLIKPVQYILRIIISIINGFSQTLNIFRYQAKIIRKMFADIVVSTADKISNSYAAMQFYQAKLVDLTKRQQAMFQLLLYFADAMKMTLTSLINGPVMGLVNFFPTFGVVLLILLAICVVCAANIPFVSWVACPICALCFKGDTLVSLEDYSEKAISDIQIGDRVALGGEVTSTLIFYIGDSQCDVYNYHGVIVSGSHLAFENDKPIRIADSKSARLLNSQLVNSNKNNPDNIDNSEYPEYLHCLINENHLIKIGGRTYGDFYECGNKVKNQQALAIVIRALNNQEVDSGNYGSDDPTYQWGLAKGTMIYTIDGRLKKIEDIQIGDLLAGGGQVYGLVKHSAKGVDVYTDGILTMSGTQAIKKGNVWDRFYKVGFNIVDYHDDYLYHVINKDHLLVTEGHGVITDYLELREDHPVFEKIHDLNISSYCK